MGLWQIASGDSSRDYSGLCLDHDVMLIGPGQYGEYDAEQYTGVPMRHQIRSFARNPKEGDVVLLRNGHHVMGVGRIPDDQGGGYQWLENFDDVLGWDLQHTRRVIWEPKALDLLADQQPVFKNYKQQRTFTRVREKRLTKLLPKFEEAIPERPLKELPTVGPVLEDEQVGVDLFSQGLANEAVERVLGAIRRARRLQQWYWTSRSGKRPSETEAVAHMVVPLLLGLGWSEQLLAIEWRRVDLAVFRGTPTTTERCIMVCEAKAPGHGLETVFKQAQKYVERLNLEHCRKIMTTDGTRIYLYQRTDGEWEVSPSGYVNLFKIRRNYLLPSQVSGIRTLVSLIPGRIAQPLRRSIA